LTPTPSINVIKIGTFIDTNLDTFANVGEKIHYTFNVTNTGNVPLVNVRLIDNNAVIIGGPIPLLAVGQSDTITFTGEHNITLQDIIDGRVINQATVVGTPPVGPDVNDTSDDPTTAPSDDPTIVPIYPQPPLATDNNFSVPIGDRNVTLDIVGDDFNGTFALDPATVVLTPPPGAMNIVLDSGGDVVGFDVPGEGRWSVDLLTGAVTFTPISGYVGDPTPIEYTVFDTQSNGTTATIRINYHPVANDDSNTTLAIGDTAQLSPFANDQNTSLPLAIDSISLVPPAGAINIITDAIGDIVGFDMPGEGVWSVDDVRGIVTFVPDVALIGNPTDINYTVREIVVPGALGSGDVSNVARLHIAYAAGAGVPTAIDDGVIAINHYGGTPIDVLVNDSFGPDGPNIGTIVILTQPTYGTVSLDDGGTPNNPTDDIFIFVPIPNVPVTQDSFTYMITDANGDQAIATVRLSINCASTQTSDGGDTLGILGMLMMMFMTMMTGLYFVRRDEIERKRG
jgi:CshA-type fibril repeat protein